MLGLHANGRTGRCANTYCYTNVYSFIRSFKCKNDHKFTSRALFCLFFQDGGYFDGVRYGRNCAIRPATISFQRGPACR